MPPELPPEWVRRLIVLGALLVILTVAVLMVIIEIHQRS